jgi:hypothetical protein
MVYFSRKLDDELFAVILYFQMKRPLCLILTKRAREICQTDEAGQNKKSPAEGDFKLILFKDYFFFLTERTTPAAETTAKAATVATPATPESGCLLGSTFALVSPAGAEGASSAGGAAGGGAAVAISPA